MEVVESGITWRAAHQRPVACGWFPARPAASTARRAPSRASSLCNNTHRHSPHVNTPPPPTPPPHLRAKLPYSLLPFRLIASGELVEQFGIHLHECLKHVVDECYDSLIPVLLADSIQCREHYGHYHMIIFFHQWHYVFVVPKVKRSFSHLKKIILFNNFVMGYVCSLNIDPWHYFFLSVM